MKLNSTLDVSLETKAVEFLESVNPDDDESADAFLSSFASFCDDSETDFVQCISVLISSASQVITTAAMKMLDSLIDWCSDKVHLPLVKADLIPQLILLLNPLSLSFAEAVDIHACLISIISDSIWLSTPHGLTQLGIEDYDEQQAVHETVLQQVLVPSEKYILHLCMNRFSIINGNQSYSFLTLLAQLLRICPYYQPTMDFVLNMPVVLTIPSCLTFFEDDYAIWAFLLHMNNTQRDWNEIRGETRQMWKTVRRMLRMEGIEDVMEEKLKTDQDGAYGGWIISYSIEWNNQLGMHLPEQE
ncbi:hypothetical protein BLNAU_19539 [Blattamonas nauphoetae]|uniref:Uncharacterized protein n=1 Tax=Blattamonas nauphoetae TaxID=2049346 RepID=A0ABQ9X173_9EUKA|nr:hypothetical protein BLNAU_19539 [Blattamonas nauphoetae]